MVTGEVVALHTRRPSSAADAAAIVPVHMIQHCLE